MTLTTGADVRLRTSGSAYRVGPVLGSGGQGTVYDVAPVDGGARLALKWYRPDAATRSQERRLHRLLDLGAPSEEFLWPLELADSAGDRSWGYVMHQRRDRFTPLSRVVNGRVDMELRPLLAATVRIASAFRRLHTRGLCYADISLHNVFVDPGTGNIQICDNDNVTVDGERSDVLGTPYFMAPELVRREAAPGIATDRHALAVMLFCVLTRHHPLLGARETAQGVLGGTALERLLGAEPLFVFDPADETNRPLAEAHANALVLWPVLPAFLRALFTTAFTDGLQDPGAGRVTETEWRSALERARGLVRRCRACGCEQFYDEADPYRPCAAPDCRRPLGPLPRIVTRSGAPVVLEDGRELRRSDLTHELAAVDPLLGDVVRHPVNGALALRNRSDAPWTLLDDAGRSPLQPRAAVVLRDGLRLLIGDARASVRL